MSTDPINTMPIQQLIQMVKVAEQSRAKEVRLDINQAKTLAFTLGEVMSRLHGDLEKLVDQQNKTEEVISVTADGGQQW